MAFKLGRLMLALEAMVTVPVDWPLSLGRESLAVAPDRAVTESLGRATLAACSPVLSWPWARAVSAGIRTSMIDPALDFAVSEGKPTAACPERARVVVPMDEPPPSDSDDMGLKPRLMMA